jgi:hypothetical protein
MIVLMLLLLSACGAKKSGTKTAPEARSVTGNKTLPGGAQWSGESGEDSGSVELVVPVPPATGIAMKEVKFGFYLPRDSTARSAAQAMASAWNEQTDHHCAAKAIGNSVYFFGDPGSGGCGSEYPLKDLHLYVNGVYKAKFPATLGEAQQQILKGQNHTLYVGPQEFP